MQISQNFDRASSSALLALVSHRPADLPFELFGVNGGGAQRCLMLMGISENSNPLNNNYNIIGLLHVSFLKNAVSGGALILFVSHGAVLATVALSGSLEICQPPGVRASGAGIDF